MKLGSDNLFENNNEALLKGKRLGLLAHAASRDSKGVHILDRLVDGALEEKWTLSAVFAPEHGLEGTAQDMEPVGNSTLSGRKKLKQKVPVHSLYGSTFASLSPTPEMLKGIDTLVIDLQDIGSRYYTYLNTMALCMRVCHARKVNVIVCDRPNPINGVDKEGAPLDAGLRSFVGMYPIPVRHAMTIGEYARLAFNYDLLDTNGTTKEEDFLNIIPMTGWRREQFWDETGLKWINPSPNMRSIAAALLYPGMCLLEATNISEGRGTHTPFEVCGAPWINGLELARELRAHKLKGIDFEPTVFTPTTRKFEGERCEGVQFTITDRHAFRPYHAGLVLIYTIASLYKKDFHWRRDPYEFVSDIPAIDLLTGGSYYRKIVDKKLPLSELGKLM